MDKSNPDKPQPMDGVDEEKEFLKKLESMKITTPAQKIKIKTVRFNFEEKVGTSSGITKFSGAEQHERMRVDRNFNDLFLKKYKIKRSRKSVRFAPISRPVSGRKTEKVEIKVLDEKTAPTRLVSILKKR